MKQNPNFLGAQFDRFTDVFMGDDPWLTGGQPRTPKQPEGAPPRAWQYTPGYNIAIQPRSTEQITFEQLRALSEYDLVRVLIERIKDTLKAHEWDIVPKDEGAGQSHDQDIAAAKDFLESPDRRNNWDDWLGKVLEEKLVTDAVSVYVHKTRSGKLWALEPIDGSTVKVLTDDRGFEPIGLNEWDEPPAYQQFLYGVPYVNLRRSDLIYRPSNRRVNHFYGFPPVEQIAITINMGLRRQFSNLAQFTDGNIPEAFGSLPPDWKPQEIKQWSEYWDAVLAGDPQNRAKVRWMPGGPGVGITKMKDEEIYGLFNKFDEWLARVGCFAFGLSPMAFIQLNNRAAAQEMGDQEAENGIAAAKLYVERLMNFIVQKIMMLPHLCFNWITDRSQLQQKRVTRNVEYAKAGIFTIDEIRIEEGKDPLGLPPGMITATGFAPFPIGAYAPVPQEPPGPVPAAVDEHRPHQDHAAPPQPAAPAQQALIRARLDELGKWERFALARLSKGTASTFQTVVIDDAEAKAIAGAISKAKTPDHIRHIFSTRRLAKHPIRFGPPRAGESSHFTQELRSELRGFLLDRASDVVQRKNASAEGREAKVTIPQVTIEPVLKVDLPEQKAPIVNITVPPSPPPAVQVHVPEAKAPTIHIPAPVVNVKVPQAPAPIVRVEPSAPVILNEIKAPEPTPVEKRAPEPKK